MELPPEAVPADQYQAPPPTDKSDQLPPDAISADDYSQFDRNKGYAKPGPYQTDLNPGEEQKFRNWLKANPGLPPFDPTDQSSDYDMRGFYKALKKGDPRAKGGIDPYDKKLHLPDVWKTPYHRTFSRESVYATDDAPHWEGDRYLVNKDGKVVWDDQGKSHERPGLYTPREIENAASGNILDFGGHGSETVADILRPILGSGAAEQGANAIKNLYEALPYIGILAGLKGPRGEGIETGIPKDPPGAPPPGPPGPPGPPNQPVYRELGGEAPQGPSRPVTPITAPRPETPITPSRPETAIPPARPETPIPPARPETSFAADAVAAQPEPAQTTLPERPSIAAQPDSRVNEALEGAGTGPTGINDEPTHIASERRLVYRDKTGTPLAMLSYQESPEGKWAITDAWADSQRGVMGQRAAGALMKRASEHDPEAWGPFSDDATKLLKGIQRRTGKDITAGQILTPPERPIPAAQAAPEPPEPAPAQVIAPEAAPAAAVPTGRAAIGRTIEGVRPAIPIETIGDTPIEQGDRDFAALLKDGATKDADLAKFISKPKKAEPIIMQARRLYNDSNGEISPIDLGKRLGIPKRTAQAMVKSLDQLAAADEKKLTLTAPTESTETPPAGEETAAEPSQAELEAAGQTSMFGPSPAAAPKPELTLTPQAQEPLPPEAVPERTYTPDRFAGTEETIGAADPNSRVVPRNQIFVSPEHFQYKVGGNEQGAGLSLMGADKFDYNAAKDLLLWYDEKGEIGPAKRYYVVNGHQRLALATRDNAEYVPATVLDSGNSLKDSIAQGVTKENARARGAVLNFQQGRGTSIDAATFMRDGGLTEDELKTHYRQLDLGEKNVKEAIELSKLDNWLWAEVANHRLKPELGAVIGRELPNNPPAQFSIFKHIERMREQGQSISEQRLDDEINAQKIAGAGTFESETKDMFGAREMRKSLVKEVADLWGKARQKYAEGKLHGQVAKKAAELEKGSTKIDVETAKSISAESARRRKEFDTFRKINGSETVRVTREYAAKLAAEPKMSAKIYDAYIKAIVPATDADKVNFRLQPGEMQIKEPQAELPVK